MTQEQAARHQSPSSIRSEVFSHRLRGLDEEEVRDYLDLLADQVETTDAERATLRSEVERMRAENDRMRAENDQLREQARRAATEVNPQAVALFSQAQQVADQLVEDAVAHVRDLLMSAHSQKRDILRRAQRSAQFRDNSRGGGW